MPDVFISYSRQDRQFIEWLHGALEERGKDVWVDWEDIPATSDWFDRISSGIRDSGAFVFVMTPASLSSEICARELEYAAESGKRIVPVVQQDLGDAAIPASLARIQWIELREWSEEGVDRLVEAIEIDPEWVEAHTRWLQFADRWERSNRDPSTLLRGAELRAAEEWLATPGADSRDPAPTPLQYEYVLAGRAAETRRQRIIRIGVTTALVVAVVLGVVALIQRNQAVDERRAAQSRALSANAFLNLPTDPELSVLLAREAADVQQTQEAEDALRQALIASRVRATLEGHTEALADLAISPDGSSIATASDDETARVWNASTGELLAELEGHEAPLNQVQFSPAGDLIATNAQDGMTRLWDSATGKLQHELLEPNETRLTDFAFSPDGSRIATAGFVHARVRIWNTDTGELQQTLAGFVDHLAFSPDGETLITATQGKAAVAWDPATGVRLNEIPAAKAASYSDLEYSPSGDRIAFAVGGFDSEDPASMRLLTAGGELVADLTHDAPLNDVAFSANGDFVATASDDTTARIWDATDGTEIATLAGHSSPVNSVSFSPNDELLVTSSEDGTARLWDVRSGRSVADLRGHQGSVAEAAFSPDGETVATAGRDGTARLWSGTESGGSFDKLAEHKAALGAAMSPTGAYFATENPDLGSTEIVNSTTGRVLDFILSARQETRFTGPSDDGSLAAYWRGGQSASGKSSVAIYETGADTPSSEFEIPHTPREAEFSTDGSELAIAGMEGYAALWSTEGEQLTEFVGHDRVDRSLGARAFIPVNSIDLSPDGSFAVTSSPDGTAILWDARSGDLLREFEAFTEEPEGMANLSTADISADGTQVVTAAIWEDVARVWDVESGELLAELRGHTGGVFDAAFGAEDSLIVTGGLDATTRVWQASTGRPLVTLRDQEAGVTDVSFEPDGSTLKALGASLVEYSCSVCGSLGQLLDVSEDRVTRELSDLEEQNLVEVTE